VRWDSLFDDLEGQLEQELSAEDEDLRTEEERLRLSRLTRRDRLAGVSCPEGAPIRVRLSSGDQLTMTVAMLGRDWLSGEPSGPGPRASLLIPLDAIAGVVLGPAAAERDPPGEERGLTARLGFAFVLRDLARRRVGVELRTRTGILTGTIDRVGRDHLDLALHDLAVPRRRGAVSAVELVVLSTVLVVRIP
jgi:hypothetical protein